MEEYEINVKIRITCESETQARLICESIEMNDENQVMDFVGMPFGDLKLIELKADMKKL